MSERRNTPIILRMLADEVEANDALTQALETARAATVNASKHGLLEICRLDSLLQMTALEAAALAADLDWLQERWMDAHTQHEEFVQYLMDDNTDTRLTYRDEVKAEFTEERDRTRAVIHQHENTILRLNTDLAEQTRLRVAAFERNAQIEKELKAFTETPYSVRLEKQTRDAMTALRDVIGWQSDRALIQALERIVTDLGAPTLPRRATPGMEVEV